MSGTFRDLWEVAKERFKEGLTVEERRLFNSVKPEEVVDEAGAVQKGLRHGNGAWYMRSKLVPLAEVIWQYGTALDIISATQAGIICPMWGGLRVLLAIAESSGKYYNKLLDMLERIGDVLPRVSTFAKIFTSKAYLLHALSLVYSDVLRFCTAAKRVLLIITGRNQGDGSHTISSMKSIWKFFEDEFGSFMDELRKQRGGLEKDAGPTQKIESSNERELHSQRRLNKQDKRSIVRQHRLEDEQRRKEVRWNLIISRLCPYNYDKKMQQSQRTRHKGTCSWIKECDTYKNWSNSSQSTVLWVHGKAGSGKTILSGWVFEAQTEIAREVESTLVMAYLCDFKQDSSLSSLTIVQGLIKQILLSVGQTGVPESLLEELESAFQGSKSLGFEDAADIFFSLARMFATIKIILDGIDECDASSREDVLNWISRVDQTPDTMISIYISSRNDIEIKERLEHYPSISLSKEQPCSDLDTFIIEKINQLREKGALKLNSLRLYEKVVEELTTKANGMFLWASLQLKDICDCVTEPEVEEALDRLPIGLYETYERNLRRTFIDCKDHRIRSTSNRVYNWVYHAKRPLTVSELMEAISIDIDDKNLNRSKIPVEEQRLKVIKRCGNLLEYDESEETVTFFHYTLKQYITALQHPEKRNPFDAYLNDVFLTDIAKSICSSEKIIANVCLTYLSFSDFETALVPFHKSRVDENMQLIQEYTTNLAIPGISTKNAGKKIQSILRGFKLMNGFFNTEPVSKVKIDFSRYIYRPTPPPEAMLAQYKLLDYTRIYWLQHCRSLSITERPDVTPHAADAEFAKRFPQVCFERETLFEIRPWGKRHSQGLYPYTDAFVWAVENDHYPLLWLIEMRSNDASNNHYRNLKLDNGTTLAHIAATHSTRAIFSRLVNVEKVGYLSGSLMIAHKDARNRNCLHVAAINGSFDVAEYILFYVTDYDYGLIYDQDIYENTPFDYAVESGLEVLISLMSQGSKGQKLRLFSSPGWLTNGESAPKLEKFFSLACSVDIFRFFSPFTEIFDAWIRNSTSSNIYLITGLKNALETRNYWTFQVVLKALPPRHTEDPNLKRLITHGMSLAMQSRAPRQIRDLLEPSAPEISFRGLLEEWSFKLPLDLEELEIISTLGPYPAAVPALLVIYFSIMVNNEISATIPLKVDFGGLDCYAFQAALLDLNIDAFKRVIRVAKEKSDGFTQSFLMYFWQNLSILLHLEFQKLFEFTATSQEPSAISDSLQRTHTLVSMGKFVLSYYQLPYSTEEQPFLAMVFANLLLMIRSTIRHTTHILRLKDTINLMGDGVELIVDIGRRLSSRHIGDILNWGESRLPDGVRLRFLPNERRPLAKEIAEFPGKLFHLYESTYLRSDFRYGVMTTSKSTIIHLIRTTDPAFANIIRTTTLNEENALIILEECRPFSPSGPLLMPCVLEAVLEKFFMREFFIRSFTVGGTHADMLANALNYILGLTIASHAAENTVFLDEDIYSYAKSLIAAGAHPMLQTHHPAPSNRELKYPFITAFRIIQTLLPDSPQKDAILTLFINHEEVRMYPRRIPPPTRSEYPDDADISDSWEYRMRTIEAIEQNPKMQYRASIDTI